MTKEEIISLALADIRSKLSVKQKNTITEWLKEDRNNAVLYNNIKDLFFVSKEIPVYKKIDNDVAWKDITSKIINHRRKRNFFRTFKYAAAILLLLGFSTLTYYLKFDLLPEQNEKFNFSQITKPGVRKAFVKLSDDKIIELNDSIEQCITEDQFILSKDSQNRLSYKISQIKKGSVETLKNYKHTVFVPRGGEYSIQLNDGTKVWLNSMTKMIYPVVFAGTDRIVYLSGEAYFEVAKDSLHPFIVNTSNNSTKVLGTSFNCRAYSDENQTEITLVEGMVCLSNRSNNQIISPGEQAVVRGSFDMINVRKVNTQLYTSWKDGQFRFHRMSMERIAENLGRWYNVDFVFLDKKTKSMRFTGTVLKEKPIDFILKMIEETTNIKFTIQRGAIAVKQK